MKTRKSQAARRKEAAELAKQQVIYLLRMSEDDYNKMQYNVGLDYLMITMRDVHAEKEMETQPKFWAWWRNHWHLRDENYLRELALSPVEVRADGTLQYRDDYQGDNYSSHHSVYNLTSDLHPNGKIMHESFAKLMGILIDQAR